MKLLHRYNHFTCLSCLLKLGPPLLPAQILFVYPVQPFVKIVIKQQTNKQTTVLPWHLLTNSGYVMLEFSNDLQMLLSIRKWEHPISVPLSSMLTFFITIMEVKAPEELVLVTLANTFRSGGLYASLLYRKVMMQNVSLPSHQYSAPFGTEQMQMRLSPAHPEKIQLKLTSWVWTTRGWSKKNHHDIEDVKSDY